MVYRAAAALIVAFWLTMTGLLLQKELAPGSNKLREVPVAHVMKRIFAHGQTSELNLYSDRQLVGRVRIHPQVRDEDDRRLLDFGGSLFFAVPGQPRQRVTWSGAFEMDQSLELQFARLQLNFRDPSAYGVELTIDPRAGRLSYHTRSGDRLHDRGEFALNQEGALGWLREQGFDPALLPAMPRANATPPTIKAWESRVETHGQKLDAYRVAVEHGGQTLFEFHVNQIGQILQAKSFFGYTAAPEDALP